MAPDYSVFFNSSFEAVGTIFSLAALIETTTGIPSRYFRTEEQAFRRSQPKEACTAERLRWASTRKATRVEDEAYSLLGLLGVNMPLLYGEGSRAFRRLQTEIIKESNDESTLAWYNSTDVYSRALAPSAFYFYRGLISRCQYFNRKHYEYTNMGIRFTVPICQHDGTNFDAHALEQRVSNLWLLFPLNCHMADRGTFGDDVSRPLALMVQVMIDGEALNLKYLKGFRSQKGLCILNTGLGGQIRHEFDGAISKRNIKSGPFGLKGTWTYVSSGKPAHYNLVVGTAVKGTAEDFSLYIDA